MKTLAQYHEWTPLFHGLTHLGKLSDPRRSTVQVFSTGRAQLTKYYRGCGFSPKDEMHSSVEAAKSAGELWIEEAR